MSMWRSTATWTLRARVTALVAATALVLGIIAATATVVALHNQSQVDRLISRQPRLTIGARPLLAAMLNQEAGIGGYALNGRPDDLQPYNQGVSDESASEAALLGLLDDHPDLAARVRRIQSGMTAGRADTAAPVIAAVQAGDPARAQAAITDRARRQFDDIRTQVARLQDAITTSRDATARAVTDASGRLVELLIAAGLVILLAGIMLAVLLRYLVIGPVARLAAEVRRVVGGDYDHVVSIEGPPEVGRLAGDVESMRRKIVRDLQEVRRARVLIEETNQQLESQAEELTRSNRDLEQFAYVASHDLQEPLRKVISFCQLLQRRYAGRLDERADQYIAFAVDGAQRMQRLINDLLAFSRIGRLTSGFTEVNLDALVREAVQQRESDLAETDGEVTRADLPAVPGEEPLLASLLGYLISNSINFRRPRVPPRV